MTGCPSVPLVVPFDDYTPDLRPWVGGKNASLGEMTVAGLPVPPGFAVTTEAFGAFLADADVFREVNDLVSGADPSDASTLEAISHAARARIEDAPRRAGWGEAVAAAYQRLCDRCGSDDLPVAVRSSATCEDGADASFAGQHDTFLWVRSGEEITRHVVRCWSSQWTARALCYRARMGYGTPTAAMSVGVQRMVRPRAAGVAFTLDPRNGDRSQVAIDASWGMGQAVVAGEVTPDHYLVDKVVLEITGRWLRGCDTSPCLTDAEIRAVARLARLVERQYGCPQDIEWAIDSELEPPDNLVLLQARPETVWSRRPRAQIARTAGVLDSIVSTLCAPLRSRPDHEHATTEQPGR